jgi:hypothetical protein
LSKITVLANTNRWRYWLQLKPEVTLTGDAKSPTTPSTLLCQSLKFNGKTNCVTTAELKTHLLDSVSEFSFSSARSTLRSPLRGLPGKNGL